VPSVTWRQAQGGRGSRRAHLQGVTRSWPKRPGGMRCGRSRDDSRGHRPAGVAPTAVAQHASGARRLLVVRTHRRAALPPRPGSDPGAPRAGPRRRRRAARDVHRHRTSGERHHRGHRPRRLVARGDPLAACSRLPAGGPAGAVGALQQPIEGDLVENVEVWLNTELARRAHLTDLASLQTARFQDALSRARGVSGLDLLNILFSLTDGVRQAATGVSLGAVLWGYGAWWVRTGRVSRRWRAYCSASIRPHRASCA